MIRPDSSYSREREDAACFFSKGKARAFDHGRPEAFDAPPKERKLAPEDGLVLGDHRVEKRGHRPERRLELHGAGAETRGGESPGGPFDEHGPIGVHHDFPDVGFGHQTDETWAELAPELVLATRPFIGVLGAHGHPPH